VLFGNWKRRHQLKNRVAQGPWHVTATGEDSVIEINQYQSGKVQAAGKTLNTKKADIQSARKRDSQNIPAKRIRYRCCRLLFYLLALLRSGGRSRFTPFMGRAQTVPPSARMYISLNNIPRYHNGFELSFTYFACHSSIWRLHVWSSRRPVAAMSHACAPLVPKKSV